MRVCVPLINTNTVQQWMCIQSSIVTVYTQELNVRRRQKLMSDTSFGKGLGAKQAKRAPTPCSDIQ